MLLAFLGWPDECPIRAPSTSGCGGSSPFEIVDLSLDPLECCRLLAEELAAGMDEATR